MSKAISYGSITLVDLTDIGQFSVYPMSNLPQSVIYNPDQNSFTPSWTDSNLQLTPVCYYAGKQITLGSSGLSITWKRQEGIAGASSTLNTGEAVTTTGILNVTKTQFTAASSMLTYIVSAEYTDSSIGTTLRAQGQITFSLVKQASSVKSCSITGESIFKYNGDGSLSGASTITLTGTLSNENVSGWYYQTSGGTWTKYPNSTTATTLTVTHSDSVFVNDKAVIKLATSSADVFDVHTITKLRDGAAGTNTVTAVLTNEDQMIPFNNEGVGDYTSAKSQIIIYEGGTDVTSSWTITQTLSGVTATASKTTATNDTVTVTSMSGTTGNVLFTCTKSGANTITKTFSVVKIQSGADGVNPTIYSLQASAYVMNKSIANAFTPASVKFSATSTNGTTKSNYSGRFVIYENVTVDTYSSATAKYTSTTDETSHSYSPSTSATSIFCVLYASGGTTTRLDYQTVATASDGKTGSTGATGAAGSDAINVITGNEVDVIPCTSSNTTAAAMTITIPFGGYKGISRIACTVATPAQLFGVSATVTNATSSADGSIVYTIPSGKSVSEANGVISLTFTCSGQTIVKNYSWTRSTAATNGVNAVLFQLYTPKGNVITQDVTSIVIDGQMMNGATDVTASVTAWNWAKYDASTSAYVTISGQTTKELTVNNGDVSSYASYRCIATYGGKSYTAYYSVLDKSDPIQVVVFSSLGTQIVNGQGYGALYCKVMRNGLEIDNLKSETFSTTAPSSPTSGDMYYNLNSSTKKATLMKYTGTGWAAATEGYTGTYTWSFRDKDGNATTPTGITTNGKVIYIDGSLINGKLVADVEVDIE